MTERITKLPGERFDAEVQNNPQPVLVDFYADWCGPCQALAPALQELAADYADRVAIRKVDVDAEPELARRFGVRGIPTLILFQDGEIVETRTGVASKGTLSRLLDEHLTPAATR